jgi:VWFA-related protein
MTVDITAAGNLLVSARDSRSSPIVYHRRVDFSREVPVLRPLRSLLILSCLATQHFTLLDSQTVEPNATGPVVFQANAQTVILDVVVTGQNWTPVEGLHKQDFLLTEDGHPQTITSFEEHTGAQSVQAAPSDLPPNIFTNVARVTPTDSLTILLLDSLNTPSEDLSMVREQLLNYVRSLKPGKPVAIFSLGTRLRLIQGITTDPTVLAEALKNRKSGTPMLWSNADMDTDVDKVESRFNTNPQYLQQLRADEKADQTDHLVQTTFAALQELARSLAGVPGRKNVVWLSGAFPTITFADRSLIKPSSVSRNYEDELQKTDALLTAGQVAIYPIATGGLTTNSQDIEGPAESPESVKIQQNASQHDTRLRNSNQATMDQIAKETGGIAFYNANGINDALARAMDHGSHFYTLTYTPTNSEPDGRYRRIEVKLANNDYKLAYRPGYYSVSRKVGGSNDDSLRNFMHPGMPDSTQIHFALQVQPEPSLSGKPPAPQVSDQAEGSTNAGGQSRLKGPHTRYTVEFGIAQQDLQLNVDSDGTRRGKIESVLIVYDHDGKVLNWVIKHVDLHIDAAHYKSVQVNGIHFPLEIDIPKSGTYLQAGVYDKLSNQDGTLQIPLSSVAKRPE